MFKMFLKASHIYIHIYAYIHTIDCGQLYLIYCVKQNTIIYYF